MVEPVFVCGAGVPILAAASAVAGSIIFAAGTVLTVTVLIAVNK
jgi:hypothetical protein